MLHEEIGNVRWTAHSLLRTDRLGQKQGKIRRWPKRTSSVLIVIIGCECCASTDYYQWTSIIEYHVADAVLYQKDYLLIKPDKQASQIFGPLSPDKLRLGPLPVVAS